MKLLALPDRVVAFFEANGAHVNSSPEVHAYTLQMEALPPLPMDFLEYRLTDTTGIGADGHFWAINYFYPAEAGVLDPAEDPLAATFGEDPTHMASATVERLVELTWSLQEGVRLSGRPPVQLRLLERESRNWEGIARLDGRGFLLVTDRFPTTLFAFVPFPLP